MKVYKLTEEQSEFLRGKPYGSGIFAPVKDADGNWFIGAEEVEQGTEAYPFLKDLEEIDYKPLIIKFP